MTNIIILFIIRLYKRTKTALGDEHLSSREFWMFMGSMFLILSLIQVFSGTSIPVFNKLFGYKTGIPVAADYNRVQLWMAMPIMALMAIGQYFSYRESNTKLILKQVIITFSTALILTFLINLSFKIEGINFIIFLFLAIWVIMANLLYVRSSAKAKVITWGASISHVGFGVLLVGVLVSSVNQKILTRSNEGIDMAPETNEKGQTDTKGMAFNRENRILYKNKPITVGNYTANSTHKIVGTGKESIDQ